MIFGRHINRYYAKHGPILLLGLIALAMVDFVQLKIPELYRIVINGANGTIPFDMEVLLQEVCLPLVIIILLMVVGRFMWRICFFGSGIKVETDLRNRMFDHSKNLSQNYYQVNKVGNLMSLYINDLETVHDCFANGIMGVCDALLLGCLSAFKMLRMDWKLTVLSLIPATILLIIGHFISKVLTKKWEERQQAFSDLSDFSQENFSGLAVIKAYVKELKELLEFRKLNKHNEDTNVVYTKISTLMRVLVTLFIESIICVILGYGGYLIYVGRFNAGQLVEFIGYFSSVVWPMMAISELIEMSSRGKASLNRISELLDSPIQMKDKDNVGELSQVQGKIEFRGLNFRYPGSSRQVLENISFTIEAGENVGLVGKTGSGKTTLVDLILRTYNVPNGTLFVDGHDVNTVSIESVRRGCAYVPQDNFLFSETIAKNIGFAFDEADPAAVEEAAKLADIHDNIMEFHDQYATVLGERGVTVSGGQKQRISIARALMKNAPILILDDSVSAVDTKTERVILDNLKSSRAGRTTIVIAHRISTVERLDKIVFIEDGAVVAVGSHEELCRTCEKYAKMVELQRLEDEAAGHDSAPEEGGNAYA